MLFEKKKKISVYLSEKQKNKSVTAFDLLLLDYLSGDLKNKLINFGLKRIEIHIDWLPEYKCIDIQGRVKDYYFDIQSEIDVFSISYDKDEPEEIEEYSLKTINEFYEKIENVIINLD